MTQPSFGTVAPTSRRAVAYIIDALIAAGIGIVLAVILIVVGVSSGPEGTLAVLGVGAPVVWLLMVGWFVFYTVMQGGRGSIGMRAQGLRLVREPDGAPLGFGKALLRNIVFGLAASIVVGYFTPLFDGSGRFQGWHDRVVGSLMLDARTGGSAVTAPPRRAEPVPPLPSHPQAPPVVPQAAPPIPGLTPQAPQRPYAAVNLDETVRAVSEVRASAPGSSNPPPPVPQVPAPQRPAPQLPVVPRIPEVSHPAGPPTGEETLIAFVPGVTQDGPPARATPVPPAAGPDLPAPATPSANATPEGPADDAADIEDTRISIPGHRLVFTWDDGTRATVSQRTLFGRNPAPEDGAVTVSVRDETLSLSKTHFEAGAESSGGWILDRHSTNGTVIVRDGHRIACAPDERVRIRLGDAIEIGDRIVTVGGYA